MDPETQKNRTARRVRVRQRRKRIRFLILGVFLALSAVLLFTRRWDSGTEPRPVDPETTQESAFASSPTDGWEQRTVTERDLGRGTLLLVNRDHGYDADLPKTVSVWEHKTTNYFVKDIKLSVQPEAMDALNRWMDAFAAESGKRDVNIVAGWRSYDDQLQLYQDAVAEKGQAHADAYIALPGCSEHHTGLAVDLDTYNAEDGTSGGFDGKGAYAWAVEHAWEYGFIQRYPPEKKEITGIDYEPWHFRYVGLPHAYVMAAEGLCLEEYLEYLRGFSFFGTHLSVSCLGRDYEIWFCPKERVIVPAAGDYTISGNNADGCVVTVECQP